MQSAASIWESPSFRVTPRGIAEVHGEPSLDDWRDLQRRAGQHRCAWMWVIGDSLVAAGKKYGQTFEEAARLTGIDVDRLRDLKSIARKFPMSRRHDLSPWHHAAVRRLPPDMQDRFLSKAVEQGLTRQELRLLVRDRNIRQQPWPEGKYGLILADPPWKYASGPGGYNPESHYRTMEIEEIAALSVAEKAADNCVLYLWVTNHHLADAINRVLPAWGFTYVSNIVWIKPSPGMGVWTRAQHELLLIGKKGSPQTPPRKTCEASVIDEASVIRAGRREHSRKPDEVYRLLDDQYPDFPKVELFARRAQPGWAVWGNQRLDEEEAA